MHARLTTIVSLACALAAPVGAQELLQTFRPPAPAASDRFGTSVASFGNLVLVGAIGDDLGAVDTGAVYLLDTNFGGGAFPTVCRRIYANPDPKIQDLFGFSVAADGDQVVIGATGKDVGGVLDAGSAYLFDAETGALLRTLTPPQPTLAGKFGSAVAVFGQNVLVGAQKRSPTNGSGAVFLFDGHTGTLLRTFESPSPTLDDFFGATIAVVGNTVVIGAPGDDTAGPDAGRIYVFDGATGALVRAISKPGTSTIQDFFGAAVSAAGSTVLVGAPGDDQLAADAGLVFRIEPTTGVVSMLYGINVPGKGFSQARAVGSRVVISAPLEDDGFSDAGAAYVYDLDTGIFERKITNPTPLAQDQFGYALAAVGNRIVITAWQDQEATGLAYAGAAYVFDPGTGTRERTLRKLRPGQGLGEDFSTGLGAIGSHVVVSSLSAWELGAAYVFDRESGAIERVLQAPTLDRSYFGIEIAAVGAGQVAVAAPAIAGGGVPGRVYLFDVASGALLRTLRIQGLPHPESFGSGLAARGDLLLVGANSDDRVFLFDARSGGLVRTLTPPAQHDPSLLFPSSLAFEGEHVLIGAANQTPGTGDALGAVYVYDLASGAFLRALEHPVSSLSSFAWNALGVPGHVLAEDLTGNRAYLFDSEAAAVQATVSDAFGDTEVFGTDFLVTRGSFATDFSVALLDGSTGRILYDLPSPAPSNRWFGWRLASAGTAILIGDVDQTLPNDGIGDPATDGVARLYAPPPRYAGTIHSIRGSAIIRRDLLGLHLENIGPSGQDGLSFAMGRPEGFELRFADALPATATATGAFANVDLIGGAGERLATVRATDTGDAYETSVDFLPVGLPSHTLRLLLGDEVVAELPSRNQPLRLPSLPNAIAVKVGPQPEPPSRAIGSPVDFGVTFDWDVAVAVSVDGHTFGATRAEIWSAAGTKPLEPGAIRALDLTVAGLPDRTIVDEAVTQFGRAFRSVGNGTLDAGSDGMTIGFGDGELAGARIDLGRTGSAQVMLLEEPYAEELANGGILQLGIEGPERAPLALVTATDTGGVFTSAIDFTPLGATTHRVRILRDGQVVAEAHGQAGTVSGPVGLGEGFEATVLGTGDLELDFFWDVPVTLTIEGGPTVEGDHLLISSEGGAPLPSEGLGGLRFLGSRVPALTLAALPRSTEVCGDCIDNDSDGRTDRFDPACKPYADAEASGLGDPKGRGKALVACARTLAKAGVVFAAKSQQGLQKCLTGVLSCLQGDDPTCLSKAQRVCTDLPARLAAAEQTLTDGIQRRCATEPGKTRRVPLADLLAPEGLGYAAERSECASLGVADLSSARNVARCVARQHACTVARILARTTPRARELATLGGLDLASFPCLTGSADGDERGLGDPAVRGKRAAACARGIDKATLTFTTKVQKTFVTCGLEVFACVQTAADFASCFAKAQRTCARAVGTYADVDGSLVERTHAAIEKACGAKSPGAPPQLALIDLLGAEGLGHGASADTCVDLGVDALDSTARVADCIGLEQECRVFELIDRELPRFKELYQRALRPG